MTPLIMRGTATPEEVAAVLAVLTRSGESAYDTPYRRWRATRRRAIRRDPLRPI